MLGNSSSHTSIHTKLDVLNSLLRTNIGRRGPMLSGLEYDILVANYMRRDAHEWRGLANLSYSIIDCNDVDGRPVRVAARVVLSSASRMLAETRASTTICRWAERSARRMTGQGWFWCTVEAIRRCFGRRSRGV
jgi:hypothetical protein